MDSAVFQTEKQSHSTCGPDFDLHLEILPYKVLGGTVEDFQNLSDSRIDGIHLQSKHMGV